MIEEWKDVVGFEGFYQVSNLGNVKRKKLLRLSGGGRYVQVILSKNGKSYGKSVHRLVATAFLPNPDNLPCVNHKDENPKNNCVDNLEWCTYKYNNEYNGRVDKCKNKISATLRGRKPNIVVTEEVREHYRAGARKGWEKRKLKKFQKGC